MVLPSTVPHKHSSQHEHEYELEGSWKPELWKENTRSFSSSSTSLFQSVTE